MSQQTDPTRRVDPSFTPLMRSIALELAIYAPLVTLYFFLVIRLAKTSLEHLYHQSSIGYATVSTLVIVAQGVLLEAFTSWLLRRIGLRK